MANIPHHKVRALGAIAERLIGDLKDNSSARRMQAEVNRLRSGAEALDNVRANRSPLDTPEAHALKVAKLARKYDSEITTALNRTSQALHEGLDDVQRRIEQKVNLKPDAFASEIRSAFRTLPRKKQMDLLSDLVKENRGPELAAIVKAPSVLTGISDTERAQFEKAIISRHAPAELDEWTKLGEVFDSSRIATNVAIDLVKAFTDPGELAKIERQDAAAKAAGAAFDQSLQ